MQFLSKITEQPEPGGVNWIMREVAASHEEAASRLYPRPP